MEEDRKLDELINRRQQTAMHANAAVAAPVAREPDAALDALVDVNMGRFSPAQVEEWLLAVATSLYAQAESQASDNNGAESAEKTLALLYDAPRSATVQCKTKCVLWSLSREIFKKIQAISATANQIQRARWLIASPELATLSAIDLSRLVGTLQAVNYQAGDKIISEGDLTTKIVLIERGHAGIASSKLPMNTPRNEVDKTFGILRPREGKRRSVEFMNARELGKYLENSNDIVSDDMTEEHSAEKEKFQAMCEVYEGRMTGIGALRGRANLPDAWPWVKTDKGEGAQSPISIVAQTNMNCLVFSVEVFENLFGPAEKVIKSTGKRGSIVQDDKPVVKELTFDATKFKMKYILGSGSFGVVTLAEYRVDKAQPPVMYALKSLSKLAVIETGQLRHVLDE
eukprot:gene18655-21842_t